MRLSWWITAFCQKEINNYYKCLWNLHEISRLRVAVQHKGFCLDSFHYKQPNDLNLLYFLSLCKIKGSECIYRALEGINHRCIKEYPALGLVEVSSAEKYTEDLAGKLNDVMWRNTGGLFVKVGCREFPAHHYRQFAPEVCCRKFLA